MKCVLCSHDAAVFFVDTKSKLNYFHCTHCDIRFLNPANYLNAEAELERYQLHENSLDDPTYKKYLQPILEWTLSLTSRGDIGLDYGCGNGPALAAMLEARDHTITLYDPFYYPDKSYVAQKYDFILATEVAEHFYSPAKEFVHLKSLLRKTDQKKSGLGIVTSLYNSKIDFSSWHYRRDPTHVCFYSCATFEWIAKKFEFSSYASDGVRLNWLASN